MLIKGAWTIRILRSLTTLLFNDTEDFLSSADSEVRITPRMDI